jgi:hypothetical protein
VEFVAKSMVDPLLEKVTLTLAEKSTEHEAGKRRVIQASENKLKD